MDTTDPEIEFDEQGVCSHCHYFDNSVRPIWPSVDGDPVKLEEMIRTVKEYGKGKRYDCIIGLSGGIDSSYIAVKVAEWGLRPLVVHVDAGWNSELAVMNIEQICRRLAEDKLFIAKKLGLSLAEFEGLITQPAHHFSEFPNHQRKKRFAMTMLRSLRIIIGMPKRFALLPFRVASRLRRKLWPKSV